MTQNHVRSVDHPRRSRPVALILGVVLLAVPALALAAQGPVLDPVSGLLVAGKEPSPTALTHAGSLLRPEALPLVAAPVVDRALVAADDLVREAAGMPQRYAIPNPVSISPANDGLWEQVDELTWVWRLRISSPGALSINLGFTRYEMPEGGRLYVYSSDFRNIVRPFTARDNSSHRQLWTPPVPSDDIIVELTVPVWSRDKVTLLLGSINVGYRFFGEAPKPESGPCNVDVICPEGDPWRNEIPAIAAISTGGSLFCSGYMVNNTAQDQKPFFMTANHCGIGSGNAPSLVTFWNYEATTCGGPRNGQLNQFNTGSTWRAGYVPSDFTLVELNSPPNPAYGVTYSGWDHSGTDAQMAVAIHHPNVDEKAISFEFQPTTTTSYLGTSIPGDGTHERITDWDVGTTEPGSSGSPLFNENHHVIGQLHGGFASCSSQTSDWYGKFSVSWTGGGSSNNRLSNWLDPIGSGQITVDTLNPAADCNNNGIPDNQDIINGTSQDCNANGIPDECDIAGGVSLDGNGNGVPDECEPPCVDIRGLQARCVAASGELQMRLVYFTTAYNGQTVIFDIDGVQNPAIVSGTKAQLIIPGQGGTGSRTITIAQPAGCGLAPFTVVCN